MTHLLDGDLFICFDISFFSDFIMILSYALIFTHIAASNTASDDVTY